MLIGNLLFVLADPNGAQLLLAGCLCIGEAHALIAQTYLQCVQMAFVFHPRRSYSFNLSPLYACVLPNASTFAHLFHCAAQYTDSGLALLK